MPGPGGPCSEIYVDRGPEFGREGGPVVDEDRYLEIWNLVFMQEELSEVRAKDDFTVAGPLPSRNIDTGMGLERVAYLLQGVDNLYEIDEVYPVIERAAEPVRTSLRRGPRRRRPHARGERPRARSLMLTADGVTPGNEGRGYVLRRLLRRTVRAMRLLGVEQPSLPEPAAGEHGAHEGLLPGGRARLRPHRADRVRRGGGLPPHPGGGHHHPRHSRGPDQGRRRREPERRAGVPACTTPTASRST
ncbi:hypothetical protein GCM10025868_03960 [Angustibacter aerolatus]|uniref:alanine--tRNA ligase n=1 Tax=Angustibacter aerolatus TaxID=1162965 RepID=A0ABQ6JED7_9ACTN|nr:hypothetical protein GCM10025868_03960 [Angustibacter aerolatus]